jgi:hypothetical protein
MPTFSPPEGHLRRNDPKFSLSFSQHEKSTENSVCANVHLDLPLPRDVD